MIELVGTIMVYVFAIYTLVPFCVSVFELISKRLFLQAAFNAGAAAMLFYAWMLTIRSITHG